jgi:transposase
MSHRIDAEYNQIMMMPPVVEDWIPVDHPARLVRDFINSINLESIDIVDDINNVGRPHYSNEMLLSIWIYGYLDRVTSTRALEKACYKDIGLIWLSGNHHPDNNTLHRFFFRNRKQIQKVFSLFTNMALKMKLVGLVHHALDGTKIQALGSTRSAWHRDDLLELHEQIEHRIAEICDTLAECQEENIDRFPLQESLLDSHHRLEQVQSALAELDKAQTDHMNPSDPEARIVKIKGSRQLGYNAQAVVDQDSGLIVAADVVNQADDYHLLVPMLDQVQDNLGSTAAQTSADTGYCCGEDLAGAAQRGYPVLVYMEKEENGARKSPFHPFWFEHRPDDNICICPLGKQLNHQMTYYNSRRRCHIMRYYCLSYKECEFRAECCPGNRGRIIELSEYHVFIVAQRQKHLDPALLKILAKRKVVVEPAFSRIKWNDKFTRWTQWGIIGVRAEWAMRCLAHNLRRVLALWQMGKFRFGFAGA